MQITLNNNPRLQLSFKNRELIIDLIVYLFILLFMYTAASKILTVKSFSSTLAKSPLIGGYSMFIAYFIPIIEMIISLLLIIPKTKKTGLYASLLLMIVFTTYLAYMIFSGSKLPCHCGGVISTMSWNQHMWFNIGFTLLAIIGLTTYNKQKNLRA